MSTEAIISHMNRDHQVPLHDILAHYGGVKLDLDRQGIELVDVQLNKLTLNYNDNGKLKSTVIPLDPPMKDLSEARPRFIAMAYRAADSMGVSPHRITKFFMPPGAGRVSFGVSVGLIAAFIGVVAVPSWGEKFATLFNVGPRFMRNLGRVLYGTLALHVLEVPLNLIPLLKLHLVPGKLQLLYTVATVAVGFPTWTPLKKESDRLARHREEVLKNGI